jgi:enolase
MKKASIRSLKGREILDSRGNPTVEAEVVLADGTVGVAAVPSGASTGRYEAVELRDSDDRRYGGLGVLKAIEHIDTEIASAIAGMSALGQTAIDRRLIELDGTANKARLGANAILATSLAVARAAASFRHVPLYRYLGGPRARRLPVPMLNILNGGKHASGSVDLQEFMIVPAGATTFHQAMQMSSEVYHSLRKVLEDKRLSTNVGDEGGFAPRLSTNKDALDLILAAIDRAGYKAGRDLFIALDPAASTFYQQAKRHASSGKYILSREGITLSPTEMIDYYVELVSDYPVISIEDGLAEDDWVNWSLLTVRLGNRVQIVGDDLYATNMKRLKKGIAHKTSNSILIKLNQIGTLSETLDVVKMAQKAGWTTIISHRSGETEDSTIADLAVATNSEFIKSGAPCRSERLAKYNRLLRIEEELGQAAYYPGKRVLYSLERI